jgi:hypothetical protein
LIDELDGKKIFCFGSIPEIETALGSSIVMTPHEADVILINGEGIIEQSVGTILMGYKGTKLVLCLGPSTAGIARLSHLEHWCPYGTC